MISRESTMAARFSRVCKSQYRLLVLIAIWALSVLPSQAQSVIYVKAGATGGNNGTSWSNAFTNLQSALAIANPGDEIWVAEGTYRPSANDRNATFSLVENLYLFGGFAGTENSPNDRIVGSHPTILSGDIGAPNNSSDNTINLITGSNYSVIDGFEISDGVYGLILNNEYMQITNCSFKRNINGYSSWNSVALFYFDDFEGNYTGIYCNGNLNLSSIHVESCVFKGNGTSQVNGTIPELGGGINASGTDVVAVNSLFADNTANQGGAVAITGGAIGITNPNLARIWSCTFTRNFATYYSGALLVSVSQTDVSIKNSIFWNNTTRDGVFGSELTLTGHDFSIDHSLVTGGINAPYVYSNSSIHLNSPVDNIFVDPLFVSQSDLSLRSNSPAINAGDPGTDRYAYPYNDNYEQIDLANHLRFQGVNDRIDIGAYEYQTTTAYSITANAQGCGTISPNGNILVTAFTNKTFTFLPNSGCMISSVVVDNNQVADDVARGYHTFTNVSANHQITVTFVSSNGVPFQENWENGTSKWTTDFHFGDGIIATGDQNHSLCLSNSSTKASADWVPGSSNAFSIKFKVEEPTTTTGGTIIRLIYPDEAGQFGLDLIPGILHIGKDFALPYTYGVWHELRGEVDIPNLQIRWFFDAGATPFFVSQNIYPQPFSGIQFEGGALSTCVDDIYFGNENALTVTTPSNGNIDVAPGWIRTISGPPNKYVYRQIEGGAYPSAILQANPADGYVFQSWTGDAASYGNNPSISILMNGPKSISALFQDSPVRTVQRKWGTVDLPPISVKDGVVFDVMQDISNNISPPLANFSNWVVVPGPIFKGTFTPSDQNHKGKIKGGDVQLVAQFYEPEVRVQAKDVAYNDGNGDNTESEPRILVTNVGKAILSDVYFEYYFHSECLNTPDVDVPFSPYYVGFFPLGGGNYKLLFHTGSPLSIGGTAEVTAGHMRFSCQQSELTCPKSWKWDNDYSLDPKASEVSINSLRKSIREYRRSRYLPVYEGDPGQSYPPSTLAVVKGSGKPVGIQYDDPLADPTKEPTQYPIPFSTDLPIPDQYPNLVTIHAYPLGTTLNNGNFELDSLGWIHYPEQIPNDPALKRWEIGHQSAEAQAYDGYKYLRIHSVDPLTGEGAMIQIQEGDPSFAALLAQDGKGLTGQGVVFSAWARLPSPGTGSVQFIQGRDGAYTYGDPIPVNSQGTWTFLSIHYSQLGIWEDSDGKRSIRLGIVSADAGSREFELDGATLTLGNAYSAPNISQKLSNTRGSPIQTRVRLPLEQPGVQGTEGTEILANTEYDQLGREAKNYLPYAEPCPSQSCNPYFQANAFTPEAMSRANQHYDSDPADGLPDANGFAFTEKHYEKDQVTTVDSVGKPGANYSIKSGHVSVTHYAGVSDLSTASLTSGGTLANPGNKNDPVYAYSHVVDPDGKESMEWKNGFGQVVQSAGVVDPAAAQDKYAVTRNLYDSLGNLVKILPPLSCVDEHNQPTHIQNCANPIVNTYDDEKRLIKEIHPDAGETRYYYDRLGQKRGVQTYRQFIDRTVTINVYDNLGRIVYTGEYNDQSSSRTSMDQTEQFLRSQLRDFPEWPSVPTLSRLFTKYYYDQMPSPLPEDLADRVPDLRLFPDGMDGTFENTKTRLCAVVQFHDPMEAMDPSLSVEPVSSTAYRYDKFGRVIATYAYNGFITDPGFKLQKNETDYDLAGRAIQTRHYRSAIQGTPERSENFAYNARNQLQEITDKDGASLARYDYFPEDGKVRTLTLGANGTNPITVTYQYHISGAISKITSTKSSSGAPVQEFSQQLYYDLLPGNQPGLYNGDIARQEYRLGSLPVRSVAYQYDRLNRMVNAAYDVTGPGTDPAEFDEQLEYMLDGRISELRRADGVGASTDGGQYKYYANSHRLSHVGTGRFSHDPRAVGSDAYPAFLYDEDGNMVWDESKNLELSYDYRGLPTHFGYVKNGQEYDLEVRYDHAGNRISKVVFTRGVSSSSPGGGQTSLRNEMIVDADPSHTEDYALLSDAYSSIKSQLNGVTQDPGTLTLYVVVAQDQAVDVTNLASWEPITYPGGTAKTVLKVVKYGTPAYYAVLNRRSDVMQLVSASHYTGFGNEIRQDFQVNQGIKALIDLPQGLGRYEEHGGQLYYVKNHLGSTMLASLSTGGGFQSYDYYPYGMQKVLQNLTTDKVRETFTGKELDDETGIGGLYYFGARYYDPDMGMWTAPDPRRLNSSLYAYAHLNPMLFTDPDGEAPIGYVGVGANMAFKAGLSGGTGLFFGPGVQGGYKTIGFSKGISAGIGYEVGFFTDDKGFSGKSNFTSIGPFTVAWNSQGWGVSISVGKGTGITWGDSDTKVTYEQGNKGYANPNITFKAPSDNTRVNVETPKPKPESGKASPKIQSDPNFN